MVPWQFPFLMWLLLQVPHPLIFGSGLLFCRTWLGSLCNVDIDFQELQEVVVMLCRMAFCLSMKIVVLHQYNITAKAHICNQDSLVSLFILDWL